LRRAGRVVFRRRGHEEWLIGLMAAFGFVAPTFSRTIDCDSGNEGENFSQSQ
jgi:hypothetical protein